MLEIVFNESACGCLKMAQHYGEGTYQNGCFSIIISHEDGSKPTKKEIKAARREFAEKERLAWENAVPMGGNPADIYGFHLMLSLGDISENQPGLKRKQALEHLYSIYPNDVGHQAAREIFERANQDLKTVQERAQAGEPLRIWYSNHPDDMCGIYWFMEQLDHWKTHDGQISVVKLPEWEIIEENTVTRRNSWGEVRPEEWHRYLPLEKSVPLAFRQGYASHWRELQKENAPLRAVLNGQLASAPETLYDDFILREIAAESVEFHEAKLIGRILAKYQLGVGDAWLALRIEEMIHAGKLEIVSAVTEDSPRYHRFLRKCSPCN